MRKGFTPLESPASPRLDAMHLTGQVYGGDEIYQSLIPIRKGGVKALSFLTGFTLVELLLAIGIFSIIALIVYSTFSMGINTWRKMDGLLERYQEVRLVMERMAVELRSCVDMHVEGFGNPEEKYDFYGEEDRLIFYTARRKEGGVKRVIYQKSRDEEFEADVFRLERREEDFSPLLPREKVPGDLILELLKNVEFRYLRLVKEGNAVRREWQDVWKEDAPDIPALPPQVRIKIIFNVPTGRQNEYQEVTVDKYVDIAMVKKTL